jgi:hypothetical protein
MSASKDIINLTTEKNTALPATQGTKIITESGNTERPTLSYPKGTYPK